MTTDYNCPCELILKVGCNEYDEISTAITSLLRSSSITDQKFFSFERQIQPTTYFGSFTIQSSKSKIPIQCQSLSCVIFLTDEIVRKHGNKDLFKFIDIWNFHHKIELLDEHKQIIARQDYYELSYLLPLWSISQVPYPQQKVVRFNIFATNFDLMVKFYQYLFQRKPDSSKTGFVLFNLFSTINDKLLYQFSIKYSPSIQSYTISQGAYLKLRLHSLNHFIHEYTSKLFTINKFEYYIYDPDGNLLHLCLRNISSNIKEFMPSKSSIYVNDSGLGDSSDPSTQLFNSTMSQIYPMHNDIDDQSHSSNDSVQCSSISSNELSTIKQRVNYNHWNSKNNILVRSAKASEMNCRLKQQQRALPLRASVKHQQCKTSLYESEPRLSNTFLDRNQYYSSMNSVQKSNRDRSFSTNLFQSPWYNNSIYNDYDTSYGVDSPSIQSETNTNSSTYGYLNAFLLKQQQQQQQSMRLRNVNNLISQNEKSSTIKIVSRPKSASLTNQLPLLTSKSTKHILQEPIQDTITSIADKSSQLRSKSVTFGWTNSINNVSNTENEKLNNELDHNQYPRINIGITLNSRLRKTPVLDMLRSTTMETYTSESQHLNRTNSLRHSAVRFARF